MLDKKSVRFDRRALQEIEEFPLAVKAKIKVATTMLARDGFLLEPYGKKISADLFEIRVAWQGQWRLLYVYVQEKYVVVLSGFQKKSQKPPLSEIKKAEKRMKKYVVD